MGTSTNNSPNAKEDTSDFVGWSFPAPVTNLFGTYCSGKSQRSRIAFPETADYIVFLALLKQSLRLPPYGKLQLYAYCLTTTSYQLLFAATDPRLLRQLLHALIISYNGYYIRRYKAQKAIFSDVYKSTDVDSSHLLLQASLAFHANQETHWSRTSVSSYVSNQQLDWLSSAELLALAGGRERYARQLQAFQKQQVTKKSPSRAILRRSWRS